MELGNAGHMHFFTMGGMEGTFLYLITKKT